MRTKKTRIAGKFGARYGAKVKEKYRAVASKKAQKQKCPFCKKLTVKRKSKGLWSCSSCKKTFASRAHYLE